MVNHVLDLAERYRHFGLTRNSWPAGRLACTQQSQCSLASVDCHRLAQNPLLSRVKTTPISAVILKKTQRARGDPRRLHHQSVSFADPKRSQPTACEHTQLVELITGWLSISSSAHSKQRQFHQQSASSSSESRRSEGCQAFISACFTNPKRPNPGGL